MLSFIVNIWNPFDLEQSSKLCAWLKDYTDRIYVPKPSENDPGDFGLIYVKEALNTLISRLKSELDLFHLTSATSVTLGLVNAIDSLIRVILAFKDLLPEANLEHLLVDQLFLDNFLKSLGKRLHRIAVES